jgi:hypothetical protein
MSKSTNPFGAVFELQRATIRQTGKLVEQSLTLPKKASETISMSSEDSDEMRATLFGLSRESVHHSLEAAESMQGEDSSLDELHDSVDAVFDTLDEHHEEALTTYEQEYEQVETDLSEAVDSNVEALLEAHQEFEDQLLGLFETVDEQGAQVAEQTTAVTESTVDIDLSGGADEKGDSEERPSDEQSDSTEDSEPSTPDEQSDSTADSGTEEIPDDEVVCRVCGDSFAAITHPHLQTHDMTIAEYREEFGEDVSLRPEEEE